jgi:hypothetical protein
MITIYVSNSGDNENDGLTRDAGSDAFQGQQRDALKWKATSRCYDLRRKLMSNATADNVTYRNNAGRPTIYEPLCRPSIGPCTNA